jgi:phage N-6-adenine-methyltransferase
MENKTEHFVSKSSTPDNLKDLWRTPRYLFGALDNEFNFDFDVCASEENKLCKYFFTEQRSALTNSWAVLGCIAYFMNPPYSQTQEFLQRASQQAKEHNLTVVALVNANTDTKWFADAVDSANEVRLITGRVGFVNETGNKTNGNTKGQCLIIWRGNCKTPCQITMINLKELQRN